ncbi:DNA repair protein XRCC4 [Balamuthia mandrillaris]
MMKGRAAAGRAIVHCNRSAVSRSLCSLPQQRANILSALTPRSSRSTNLELPSCASFHNTDLCSERRSYATTGDHHLKYRKELEELADLFTEARDYLEEARENANTTYFNDDLADAREAVQKTLARYQQLLDTMEEEPARKLREAQNPKMEQLKQELQMLEELHLS